MIALLDTHAWIWLVNGVPGGLRAAALAELEAAGTERAVAAISVWEVAMLAAKGRIHLRTSCLEWVETSLARARIRVLPLEPAAAVDAAALPGDFHGDPADRLIVATARHAGATVYTRDRRILDYAALGYVRAREV